MPTELQKRTAEAIVNIFETGSAFGDYGNVTLIAGDSGHLTYGRSQTTLASGNLYLLVKDYVEAPGAAEEAALSPYLPRLQARDLSLDNDAALKTALKAAGSDAVMRAVQDSFFDRVYWDPSQRSAARLNITTALGCAVVYDGTVHGSFPLIRDMTSATVPAPTDIASEQTWIAQYIVLRRRWLATNANPQLHPTVYRMDAFQQLVNARSWDLPLPLTVRGVLIDATVLAGPPHLASAHLVEDRLLHLATPCMKGEDVAALQTALNAHGFALAVDGVFGNDTDQAVRAFQQQSGGTLKPDGIVGPATRAALDL